MSHEYSRLPRQPAQEYPKGTSMVVEHPIADHAKPACETIDDWCVDYTLNRITRPGIEVRLEPKVMDVLACLARRAGGVVTRQEFEAEVWAGRVVTEDALTNAIRKLRRAFRDDPRQPRPPAQKFLYTFLATK